MKILSAIVSLAGGLAICGAVVAMGCNLLLDSAPLLTRIMGLELPVAMAVGLLGVAALYAAARWEGR